MTTHWRAGCGESRTSGSEGGGWKRTGFPVPRRPPTLLIVYALATAFQWLPPLGYATLGDGPLLNLQQLIFTPLTLAFHGLAFTARVTRSSILEVMCEDYMRTARAKGLGELLVVGGMP